MTNFYAGDPPPDVRWLVDGEIVDDEQEETNFDLARNDLVLYEVERSNLGSDLICEVTYHPSYPPITIDLTLEMYCKL